MTLHPAHSATLSKTGIPADSGERPQAPVGARLWTLLPGVCATLVLFAVAYALAVASHWPLVHDAPLMHYVVFLMDHGFAPYRDLVEINMPGSYMQEWAVMHTLGGGARAWFAWDTLTGVAALFAGAWIVGPERRWAGLSGAGLAYLLHLADGAWDLGQRDWIVAVLLLLAFGATLECTRNGRAVWLAAATCLSVFAATIKPLALPVPFLLLGAALVMLNRRRTPLFPAILWSFAGAIPPVLATILFLAHWGVWREFLATVRGVVAYYAGLQALSVVGLVRLVLPRSVVVFALGAAILFAANRSRRSFLSLLLLMGGAMGLAFFFLQRKGWTYHRYTALAFLLIWVMVEIDTAIRSKVLILRFAAAALLICGTLGITLQALRTEHLNIYPMDTLNHLQEDLARFGGPRLSGNVQCLDMALGGCVNALYRLNLVQSTGFIYDFYLFPKRGTSLTEQLQSRFLQELTSKPPQVIVISAQNWPGEIFGYDQIERWPNFHRFLEDRYSLASTFQADPQHPSIGYELFRLK